jgi:subtilisin family serine protease
MSQSGLVELARRIALVCGLAFLPSIVAADEVRRIPFQAPPFDGAFVPDEFIVVFRPHVRASLVARRDTHGRLSVSRPDVARVLERVGAIDLQREFARAPGRPPGSRFPDLTGHYTVKLAPGRDLDEALAAFATDPGVDHVERIGLHPIYLTPNDTYYANPPGSFPYPQWHYWDSFGIDADQAWDLETGDPSVVVGILDTGVKYRHTDLGGNDPPGPADNVTQGNVWVNAGEIPGNALDDDGNGFVDDVIGWDFVTVTGGGGVTCLDADCGGADHDPNDGEGHGTHLAGTIAAITNNARGAAGIAGGYSNGTIAGAGNGVKVVPLRIGYRARYQGALTGIVRMDWAAQAMNYVAGMVDDGVNVAAINCSWNSSDTGGIDAAVDDLLAHDVMIVAAAGNSSSSVANYLGGKAGVMAVAATNTLGGPASFTNFGSWVELAAPGVDILSTFHDPTDPDTTHMYVGLSDGTSMSAPHACGVAALLESFDPSLTRAQKFTLMEANTTPYSGGLDLGSGILNARLALDAAAPVCVVVAEFGGTPTTGCPGMSVNFTDQSTGTVTSWSWDFGDGGSSTLQNPSHVYAAPGTYAVSLTANGPACNDTETKSGYLTVGSAPTADFSASTTGGPAPLEVDFTDLSAQAPTSWLWDFGDGGSAATQEATHTYTDPGTYTVTLTSTNGCGSDPEVKTDYVTVLGPVGVSPAVGRAGRLVVEALGNPRRGGASLRIGVPDAEPVTLQVVDAGGRVVRELTLAGGAGERRIDWDGHDEKGQAVGAGLYLVLVRAGRVTATAKVVVLR